MLSPVIIVLLSPSAMQVLFIVHISTIVGADLEGAVKGDCGVVESRKQVLVRVLIELPWKLPMVHGIFLPRLQTGSLPPL
jgi:hypothetical protein